MERRIMFNEDDTHFFYTRDCLEDITQEDIRSFIRQYEGTQISDFFLCCGGRIADFPSKTRDSWIDKFDQTTENGCDVNYKDQPVVRCAERIFRRKNLDFYAICIDELRKINIRPWLSIRMNDCHCNGDQTSFLHPTVFHEHPEYRRVRHREPIEYFDRCFDYAVEDVYRMMLRFVEETALRYDADGIELDWQREIRCFQVGMEWAGLEIINRFTRDVRAILDRAAQKWGHPVLLCARTLPTPQMSLDAGFDAVAWAEEGLVDILVPSPRWETCDTDIPVELWKRLLRGTRTSLAVGIEVLMKSAPDNRAFYTTPEIVHALATQYLSMGADKVYLFNYMDSFQATGSDAFAKKDDGLFAIEPENCARLLRTIGAMDTLLSSERRHVVSFTDMGAPWHDKEKTAPLPLRIRQRPKFLRLRVGDVPADADVEVRLAGSGSGNLQVWVNSVPCPRKGTETVKPEYTSNEAQVFELVNHGHLSAFIVLEMRVPDGEMNIDYAEIHITPSSTMKY